MDRREVESHRLQEAEVDLGGAGLPAELDFLGVAGDAPEMKLCCTSSSGSGAR